MSNDEHKLKQSEVDRLAKAFQRNIRKHRKAQHMTQEKVAELADISPRFYQKIEQGRSVPTVPFAHLIAKALNITIDELLTE